MHEFKKKLLGTVKSDNDAKEEQKDFLPDRDAHPQTANSKSLSISQKLEELRKAFQNELDQDDQKIQKKIAGTTPVDLQVQSLEKGLQELRQAFRNEIVEKNTSPISSEYLHRIERRLEILKKRLDEDLPDKGSQIKLDDFQGLEKRIEILRKMFEIEFSKKTGIQDFEQNVSQLDQRLTELSKRINNVSLDQETIHVLAKQFEAFQLEIKNFEKPVTCKL
jgi:predicted RNase H-like nuclease (RuvC/YqgF family)